MLSERNQRNECYTKVSKFRPTAASIRSSAIVAKDNGQESCSKCINKNRPEIENLEIGELGFQRQLPVPTSLVKKSEEKEREFKIEEFIQSMISLSIKVKDDKTAGLNCSSISLKAEEYQMGISSYERQNRDVDNFEKSGLMGETGQVGILNHEIQELEPISNACCIDATSKTQDNDKKDTEISIQDIREIDRFAFSSKKLKPVPEINKICTAIKQAVKRFKKDDDFSLETETNGEESAGLSGCASASRANGKIGDLSSPPSYKSFFAQQKSDREVGDWRKEIEKSKKSAKKSSEKLVMNSFEYYDDLIIKESKIHGLGIFTPVKIAKNTLIMEYKGEIIGKCMSDKREKLYKLNNIDSVYMFSVTEDMIIDATMTGNKARYINHSCDPNCEAITSVADRSIKYCSIRDIKVDEELTINYHMPSEDGREICNCGANSCISNKLKN